MKAGKAARVTEVPLSAAAEARAKVGVSQIAVARLIGVSVRTLRDWEQGRRQPQVRHKLCCVLRASIRKLCGICTQPEGKSSMGRSDHKSATGCRLSEVWTKCGHSKNNEALHFCRGFVLYGAAPGVEKMINI